MNPKIADTTETEMHRICGESTAWVPTYQVRLLAEDLKHRMHILESGRSSVLSAEEWEQEWVAALDQHIIEQPCDWSGTVDATLVDDLVMWTCPRCGAPHEDEQANDR